MAKENVSHTHTHTHTMEYYTAIKNKIIPFAGKGRKLKIFMLGVIIQTQNDKYGLFSLTCGI
jgi:hypothetical protein